MPNSSYVHEAYQLIEEIPQDKMEFVVQLLRGTKGLFSDVKKDVSVNKREEAFNQLKQLQRKVPLNFDYDKEKQDYLEQKNGNIN